MDIDSRAHHILDKDLSVNSFREGTSAFLPVLSPRMEDLGAGPVAINVIYVTDLIIPGTDISEVPKLDVTHGVMPAGLPKRPLVLRTPPRTVS